MSENVFQDPEWWRQNVQKGDWVYVKWKDIHSEHDSSYWQMIFFHSIGSMEVKDKTTIYWLEFFTPYQARGEYNSNHTSRFYFNDVEFQEILEIRRRGSIVKMAETVLPIEKIHEEWGTLSPDLHCNGCGTDFNSKKVGTVCPNCGSIAIGPCTKVIR